MFDKKTAWFSDSSADNAAALWVQKGGKLEDAKSAQFIFSDDWEHTDTKGFRDSAAYLKQDLAVFCSQYVLDAVSQGLEKVTLGKYFLVPPEIRECIDTRNVKASALLKSTTASRSSPRKEQKRLSHTNLTRSKQQKNGLSGPLLPGSSSQMANTDVSSTDKSAVSSHSARHVETVEAQAEERTGHQVSNLNQSDRHNHQGCNNIESHDIDSIPHIKSLPKVIGYLRTICPGKDGVEVECIT